jgi:hypothetical protein
LIRCLYPGYEYSLIFTLRIFPEKEIYSGAESGLHRSLPYLLAAAVAIADENPTASLVIYPVGPVFYFISIWLARTSAPPESEVQGFT